MHENIQKKKNAGLTLLELIVAVAVLTVVTGPLIVVFNQGIERSVQSHILTMANIEAQMQMEQLIGLDWVELTALPPGVASGDFFAGNAVAGENGIYRTLPFRSESNSDFWVVLQYDQNTASDIPSGNARRRSLSNELIIVEVTVYIYRNLGIYPYNTSADTPFTSHRNILNVDGGII